MIAYPSYSQYPRRSARAEAQSYLSDVAALQQQYLVDKRAYACALTALHASASGSVCAVVSVRCRGIATAISRRQTRVLLLAHGPARIARWERRRQVCDNHGR